MKNSLAQILNRGIDFLQEGDLDEADKLFQEVIQQQESNANALHLLGVVRHEQGRIEDSIEFLEQAVEQEVNNIVFLGNLSNSLISAQQFSRAEQLCLRVLKIDGDYEPAFYHLARINMLTQRPVQAIEYCQRSLQLNVQNPMVQRLLAQLYVEEKDWYQASVNYQWLLDVYPEDAQALYGMGFVKQQQQQEGDQMAALDYFRKAVAVKPDFSEAYNGMGSVYFSQGKLQKAYSLFYQAVKKHPANVEALYNQGLVLRNMGRLKEAAVILQQAIAINSQHVSTLASYALTLQELGQLQQAKVEYENVLQLDPDHSLAQHMLCAIQGQNSEKAPDRFVKELFDVYAPAYEQHLQNELGFRAPAVISQLIEAQCKTALPFANVMDLGCGTGLMGEKVTTCTENIDGVDLAENMLTLARSKNIYRHLYHQEINHFLEQAAGSNNEKYDCCIASDVFIYFGSLQETFLSIHTILKEHGFFIFTTETCLAEKYQLRRTGRYAHGTAYISELAKACGFKILQHNAVKVRKEEGDWLQSHLTLLQRL